MHPFKNYDEKKINRRALLGLCICFLSIAVAGLADYISGTVNALPIEYVLPFFIMGFIIFMISVLTVLCGTPLLKHEHAGEDFTAVYQKNMKKLQHYRKFSFYCAIVAIIHLLYVFTALSAANDTLQIRFFISIIVLFIAVISFCWTTAKYAKCPACKKLPFQKSDGTPIINLAKCPRCSAILKK